MISHGFIEKRRYDLRGKGINRLAAGRMLLCSALWLLLSACLTLNTALPGTLRDDLEEKDMEPVGHFQIEVQHSFAPLGMGTVPGDPLRKRIMEEVNARQADGVRNLRLESYNSFSDVVTRWMTCQMVQPRTYRLSGELVRIQKAPLPGEEPQMTPAKPLIDPENQQTPQPGAPQMTSDEGPAASSLLY